MCKKSNVLKFIESLSMNSKKSYHQSIKQYEEFHGTNIEDLIEEALEEQTKQVPQHLLKVIDRLEDFQNHLINQGLVYGTIQLKLTHIKTIYKRNRVSLPYIEPLNSKTIKRREYIEYKDVLTKDEIRKALTLMKPIPRARALTIAQGGLSNEECEHLKLSSFIEELKCYHQKDDLIEALTWLADENHPVIWVTRLIRWKTKKPYYALIGSEAVNSIASAKLHELSKKNNIPDTDKLINCNKAGFIRTCRDVNNKLGLGKVADESKFRSHNLRRFHATYINGSALTYEEHSLISNSEIDEMQGRGKTSVQDTYIKSNPLKQKLLYAKVMNNVSLYHEYNYQLLDDDVIVKINDPSIENAQLKKEVKKLSDELQKKKKASDKVKELRKSLGEDGFNEMINEILNVS